MAGAGGRAQIIAGGRPGRPARRGALPACLSVLCAILGACSINPLTGKPDLVVTSRAKEAELGKRAAAQVESQVGLVADQERSAYVRAIGERLAAQVPDAGFEFQFNVVNMEQPNAFALPGGPVYVSRGLLPLVNSEDELANVIGHEVAHVVARHAARRITLGAPLAVVTGIGALATGIVSPTVGRMVLGLGGATNSLFLSRYSRSQENEADRYGMELAAQAGWQPAGMASFLRTLEEWERLDGDGDDAFSFFASHPTTPERVSKTAARAASIEVASPPALAVDRRALLARLDGMIVDQDPEEGIFVENRLLHTGLDFALEFPSGWETSNQPNVIAAAEPEGNALCLLQHAGQGADPMVAARAMAPRFGLEERSVNEIEINGLRAASAHARSPDADADLTWIAHRDSVYLILCATSPQREPDFRRAFIHVPHSFHALSAEERASIRVRRLRVVDAEAAETIGALCARSACAWSPERTAVANGLTPEGSLVAGFPVKIARDEPYRASE